MSSESDVNDAVGEVLDKWGALHILVNCAGVMDKFGMLPLVSRGACYTNQHKERAGEVSNETWKRCFAINVDGPMNLIRRCLPSLMNADPKGAIVNICSTAAVRGSAAGVAYTASKHALLGLTRSTAWSYAKEGLRCNAVIPGWVKDTDIMKGADPAVFQTAGIQVMAPYQACMPGMCKPADIAHAVLMMATATAVNGAELAVDNGWTVA